MRVAACYYGEHRALGVSEWPPSQDPAGVQAEQESEFMQASCPRVCRNTVMNLGAAAAARPNMVLSSLGNQLSRA